MIGDMPDVCPFCGARHTKFLTSEKAEKKFIVTPKRINDCVTQLMSVPRLGIEHAAYRVELDNGAVAWIDCPSAFNSNLDSVTDIYFTHKDFMGASNQYRQLFNAKVHIHEQDARNSLVQQFKNSIDNRFSENFEVNGLEAVHIGGHSLGFTVYGYKEVLFVCDYAYPPGRRMKLNPYSTPDIKKNAPKILEFAENKSFKTTVVPIIPHNK